MAKKKRRQFAPTLFDITSSRFVWISLILLVAFVALRTYELYEYNLFYSLPKNVLKFYAYGIFCDFVFVLNIAGVLLIPYILLFYVHRNLGEGFYIVTGILIIILTSILSFVFVMLNAPVNWAIFKSESFHLNNIFLETGMKSFFLMIIMIGVLGVLVWLAFKVQIKRYLYIVFFVLSIISIFYYFKLFPKSEYFYHEEAHHLSINKSNYLTYTRFIDKKSGYVDDYSYSNIRLETGNNRYVEGTYNSLSSVYPFMRENSKTDDLSSYFKNAGTPPNILIVLMESLGRSFSGPYSYLGSYTPVLDKLAEEGLYWDYFLSTSANSFNALPSLLASLPYTESGIMDLKEDIPHHFSLINVLKENGYASAYFSGFNTKNQNIDQFLHFQNIDTIIDHDIEDSDKSISDVVNHTSKNMVHDNIIYNDYLQFIKSNNNFPRIDIIHSTSLNNPKNFPGIENYHNRYLSNIKPSSMNYNQEKYKDKFAGVLAIDEALGNFLESFKKLGSYQNTIIIVTGTHKMAGMPNRNRISKYHVPFLIYSPLVKAPVRFKAVSTHLDVAPSLLNYLNQSYGLKTPSIVHWVGSGLTLSEEFKNTHSVPLMRNKNIIYELVHSKFILSDNQVFKIEEEFNLKHLKHEENLEFLNGKLLTFKEYNSYVNNNFKIISDSVYYDFFRE